MYYRQKKGVLGTSFPPTIQPGQVPASAGGVNALTNLMGMAPTDCLYTYNLMPSEGGMRLRKGYKEWATGVTGDVRSLIAYDNQLGNNAQDRLFAVSENGIYNVSVANTTVPDLEVPFTNNGLDAGWGVSTNFTTDAADHLVLYADSRNGIYQYDGDTEVWSVPLITGVDPADIAFVTIHKQRVWVIEENSSDAYYLPIDAIAGAATKFTFGSKFPNGGKLMGLWNWTVDGGDGVDDFLVAISRAGDVLVYHGTDPSQADWQLRGAYFIGELPDSRRVTTTHGGDLFVLSTYGVTSIRDLLGGKGAVENAGPAGKISRLLRKDVAAAKDSHEWILDTYPGDGFLQIARPITNETEYRQYNMNLLTNAWGWWKGVPTISTVTWRGEYYMGGPDGILYLYDGVSDNVTIAGAAGEAIEFSVLTSFQPYGHHAQLMRTSFIRPIGIVSGQANVNVKAVYDYEIDTLIGLPPPAAASGVSLWDVALWDAAVWDFSATGASVPLGGDGMGRVMAVAMRGSAQNRITLIGWDVLYTTGGFL